MRTQRDRLYLLRQLGFMRKVICLYCQLQRVYPPQPNYVTIAAADAYLQLREPEIAARLYEKVIRANPGTDVEHYIAYYYALIDSEDYDRAAVVLNYIYKRTPIWRFTKGPHMKTYPNWERIDVDNTWVMDAAYRNHEAVAEQRARQLFNKAPYHGGLINQYALILRWRGWPERSARVTKLAAAYEPYSKATRINIADNARDMDGMIFGTKPLSH